ncbi:MAG: alpha/beta hydrolase [Beijerinckiaceae bacterium]|nr:alpha/beta hydrolase [Beijerinckiaceae bacterium]
MRIATILLLVLVTPVAAIILYGFIRTRIIVQEVEAQFPPIGDFAEILGERVHYVDVGPRDAPPERTIVLIHGASANIRDILTPLKEPLSTRYRLIALDRPGHGWSSRNAGREDAKLSRQGDIVIGLIERLGIGRAVVLGHSWGGALALRLALDHRQKVAALILVSPVTHPWPGGVGAANEISVMPIVGTLLLQSIIAPVGERLIGKAMEAVFAPAVPPADFAEVTGVKLVLRPSDFKANAEDLVDLAPQIAEQVTRYPALALPILVITGDTDGIVSPELHARGMVRDVAGVELVTLNGSGHVPPHSKPRETLEAIERFLNRLEP